jgi:uncharacterized tellurite resistance protein B-like protein
MLQSIADFIAGIAGGADKPTFADTDYRLSAAALLVHVAVSDDSFDENERAVLTAALTSRFEVAPQDAAALIESALTADREAVDLYQFTSAINRALDDEGKKRLIETLFQIGYADGRLSEFEDNIIWRASELLHVAPRDRVELRKRIRNSIRPGQA